MKIYINLNNEDLHVDTKKKIYRHMCVYISMESHSNNSNLDVSNIKLHIDNEVDFL